MAKWKLLEAPTMTNGCRLPKSDAVPFPPLPTFLPFSCQMLSKAADDDDARQNVFRRCVPSIFYRHRCDRRQNAGAQNARVGRLRIARPRNVMSHFLRRRRDVASSSRPSWPRIMVQNMEEPQVGRVRFGDQLSIYHEVLVIRKALAHAWRLRHDICAHLHIPCLLIYLLSLMYNRCYCTHRQAWRIPFCDDAILTC